MISKISRFNLEMNQWMDKHPLNKGWFGQIWDLLQGNQEKYLNEMDAFIQKHILLISQKDAKDYLPSLEKKILEMNPNHPLIEKIRNIQKNLLSPDAKTIESLPYEILLHIFQEACFLDKPKPKYYSTLLYDWDLDRPNRLLNNWKNLSSINVLFNNVMMDSTFIQSLLSKLSCKDIPLNKKIELSLLCKNSIHSLDLSSYRDKLTDEHLHQLLQLPHLEDLNIDGRNLTDEGIKNLVNLTSLKIRNCVLSGITDKAFEFLINLKTLEIQLRPGWLTENSFKHLVNLRNLSVNKYIPINNRASQEEINELFEKTKENFEKVVHSSLPHVNLDITIGGFTDLGGY